MIRSLALIAAFLWFAAQGARRVFLAGRPQGQRQPHSADQSVYRESMTTYANQRQGATGFRVAEAFYAAVTAAFVIATPASAASATALASGGASVSASVLSLGPRAVQSLVAGQLFNRAGRWYLIDDGGVCFTYLEAPRARIEADRLVLRAHLSSKLGQRIGNNCAGADFSSDVTLSGKLHAADHKLLLDDIRIDRVDDESTRNALNLALQLDAETLPQTAAIDVLELVRQQTLTTGGSASHVDQFHILNVATRNDSVVIQFEVSISSP